MQNRDIATTLLKGLDLLRAFRSDDTDVSQAELARRTGYDRATVRRLCLTLVHAGFANQTERGFRLSPRVLALAGTFLRSNDVGYRVQPVLNAQAQELGAEIALAVLDGDQVLYMAQSYDPMARVSFGLTVGSTLPLLLTATGRMLLAALPVQDRSRLIKLAPLERHTHDSSMDRTAIEEAVEQAATAQMARVFGEYETGICGIAVPVSGPSQRPAVLGTTLPTSAPDFEAQCAQIVSVLRVTSTKLSGMRALE